MGDICDRTQITPMQSIWYLGQKPMSVLTCSFYISVQTTFPFHILCMSGTSSTLWKTCRQEKREGDKVVKPGHHFRLAHLLYMTF